MLSVSNHHHYHHNQGHHHHQDDHHHDRHWGDGGVDSVQYNLSIGQLDLPPPPHTALVT